MRIAAAIFGIFGSIFPSLLFVIGFVWMLVETNWLSLSIISLQKILAGLFLTIVSLTGLAGGVFALRRPGMASILMFVSFVGFIVGGVIDTILYNRGVYEGQSNYGMVFLFVIFILAGALTAFGAWIQETRNSRAGTENERRS